MMLKRQQEQLSLGTCLESRCFNHLVTFNCLKAMWIDLQGGGKISSAGSEVDVDQLKKRADRFGTVRYTLKFEC